MKTVFAPKKKCHRKPLRAKEVQNKKVEKKEC